MIPILAYHQVAEVPRKLDPRGLAIPPEQFEQQMSYLARHAYRCLTLAEGVRLMRQGEHTPAKSFMLTFDDGYQDTHSTACPILERFGFAATVFLVAGRIGSTSDWSGQAGARSGLLLSWDESRDLARRGFVLASHTLSHRRLTWLDDQSAIKEIRDSKILLEERFDTPVEYLSYPYDNTDARIEHLVESAGYKAACAGSYGPLGFFHLWRITCTRDDTPLSFALKSSGWYNKLIGLRESGSWQFLRNGLRAFRRRLMIRTNRHTDTSNHDLGADPEK